MPRTDSYEERLDRLIYRLQAKEEWTDRDHQRYNDLQKQRFVLDQMDQEDPDAEMAYD